MGEIRRAPISTTNPATVYCAPVPKPGAFNFLQDQLLVAVSMLVAGLQTSRKFEQMWLEGHIPSLPTAAHIRANRRREGSQRGLVGLVASTASFCGVKFGGYSAARKGWGLRWDAGPVRQTEALRDVGRFKSSLHLLARHLGGLVRYA